MFWLILACVRSSPTPGLGDDSGTTGTPTGTPTGTTTTVNEELEDQLRAVMGDPSLLMLPDLPADPTTATAADYAEVPQDPLNEITPEKVILGRELFFEPGLNAFPWQDEALYTVSCATCHDPQAGLSSGSRIGRGIGEGGVGYLAERRLSDTFAGMIEDIDIGPWNDTRLVNVAYRAIRAGWQGEFDSTLTEEQIAAYNEKPCDIAQYGYGGVECYGYVSLRSHGFFQGGNPAPERSVLSATSGLAGYTAYKALFDAAFPDVPEAERMTRETSALALAAFARTIITSDAPFQRFLKDPVEEGVPRPLSDAALRGGILFFGKGNCIDCHAAPAFTAAAYANIGAAGLDPTDTLTGFPSETDPSQDMSLVEFFTALSDQYPPLINEGRYDVTHDETDFGRYEIVSVYGAGAAGVTRFGHGASHDTLDAWIRHKVSGYNGATVDPLVAANLDPRLFTEPDQWLTDAEIADLVAFVGEGLTDTRFLEKFGDPDHESLGGFCSPNNDPESCASY